MQEIWVWSLIWEDPLEKKMEAIPVFLPGESHGQRSLEGYSLWGWKDFDTTERLSTQSLMHSVYECVCMLPLGRGWPRRTQGHHICTDVGAEHHQLLWSPGTQSCSAGACIKQLASPRGRYGSSLIPVLTSPSAMPAWENGIPSLHTSWDEIPKCNQSHENSWHLKKTRNATWAPPSFGLSLLGFRNSVLVLVTVIIQYVLEGPSNQLFYYHLKFLKILAEKVMKQLCNAKPIRVSLALKGSAVWFKVLISVTQGGTSKGGSH